MLKEDARANKASSSCQVARARENFATYPAAWAISKHHPYFEYFNQAYVWNQVQYKCFLYVIWKFFYKIESTLRMIETGLVDEWMTINLPKRSRCLDSTANNKGQQNQQQSHPPRLSLSNFAGIFIALLIGYLLSIFIFFTEKLISYLFSVFS